MSKRRGIKAIKAMHLLNSIDDLTRTLKEFEKDNFDEDKADAVNAAFEDFVHLVRGELADQGKLIDRNKP